jgi:hypothetical protein
MNSQHGVNSNPPQSGPDQLREQLRKIGPKVGEGDHDYFDIHWFGDELWDSFCCIELTDKAIDEIMHLIAASHNNLIDKVLAELPEMSKQTRGTTQNPDNYMYWTKYSRGFNDCLDQVKQLLLKYKGEK